MLKEKVASLEAELAGLTGQITNKKEELTDIKMKLVESGQK